MIPILFTFRRTVSYAYVFNGFTVIIGTLVMGHDSLRNLPESLNPMSLLQNTLAPHILLLWSKFCLGKGIFELDMLKSEDQAHRQGRFWRYPNMGWWWVHLFALAAVYALGYYGWA